MKVLKILGSVIVIALCLTLVGFAGFFLWSALPRERPEPAVLSTEQLFQAQEEETDGGLPEEPEPAEEPEAAPEETPEEIPEEPPEEPEQPVEEPDPYAEKARAYLETMTPEEKLWQLFLVTPESLADTGTVTQAGDATKAALEARPVGGLCYFALNLVDRAQTQAMLAGAQSYAKTPLFLAVDEEGGLVSRVGANEAMGTTYFEAAANYGQRADLAEVYNVGKTMAQELGELGFNLDFAPVADVITNPNNTEIGSRAYSNDPNVAAPLVGAMVEGLQRNGMAACLKHFPGHGSTETDSHQGKSVSARTLEQLRETEWIPFQAGIDKEVAFVMVGHQTNENLSDLPASLSPEVMSYLREELGFDGVIITDSLRMGAIIGEYTIAQAAVMAISAGADMLLMPNDLPTAFQGLQAALADGTLTQERIDESVLRILETKYRFGIME